MTFEFGRFTKITIAMFACDQPSCFDQICPAVTDVTVQANGAEPEELQPRAITINKAAGLGLGVS